MNKQFKNKRIPGTSSTWNVALICRFPRTLSHFELGHVIAFLSGGITLKSSTYVQMHEGSPHQ